MSESLQQISIQCSEQMAEAIADWLTGQGALSVSFKSANDQELFVEAVAETPLWQEVQLDALFSADTEINTLAEALAAKFDLNASQLNLKEVPEDDWQKNFQQQFSAACYNNRLWLYPSWEQPEQAPHIILEPGLAFGTGAHPTTQLCLEALAGMDLAGKTVVDYGCGSGILALAAIKLGAEKVYAIDHDPQAVLASRHNAELNQIGEQLQIMAAAELPSIQADLVLANIFANVLLELKQSLLDLLKPGGGCLLSGILVEQAEQLLAAYRNYFNDADSRLLENWVLLYLEQKR